ncbi:ferritin-like domain-containing protein [Methylobacter sp.]|uniref:ferritin-like domain-containing protein n=1 Tax=Methylobacter sp. TaxID=2051955 RepID=UPI002FDE927A
MQNYDEPILRMRRTDLTAPFPIVHQAVRIAVYDKYAARSFYAAVVEAFGQRPPFVNILRSEEQHIAALSRLCERLGIPRPMDPFLHETQIAATWLANCERGVAGEIANIRLYQILLTQVVEPEVRHVFQNLQAASLENHLPAFREAVLDAMAQERYHAAQGIPPQQAYVRHGPLSDLMEKALVQLGTHAGPLGIFSPLLRHTHPAMLAGMAVGGAGVYLLKHKTGRNKQEN